MSILHGTKSVLFRVIRDFLREQRKEGFQVEILIYIIILCFGLAAGSFLNVCISRIPEEKSIVFPPSSCPKCGARIRTYDLIPILSWLLLRGKCRACGLPISPRYPIVEGLTAVVFTLLYFKAGPTLDLAFYFVFAVLLIVISFIDIENLMIPDFLMIAGIAVGFIFSLIKGNITDSLIAVCAAFVFMSLIGFAAKMWLQKEALGEGDIKLMVMMGSFLGTQGMINTLVIGSVTGAAIGMTLIAMKALKREDYIPFGPFLALGALISILI
jgi:leader peptidase (prepilin peptidase)/N-methyltransferase